MKKLILVGELRLSDKGVVHQRDLAEAMNAERLTAWPKEGDVLVVVGKLLAGRKPALLVKAEKNGADIITVAEVLNDDVRGRLRDLLTAKPRLENYERSALEFLVGPVGVPPKPKRGSKKKVEAQSA